MCCDLQPPSKKKAQLQTMARKGGWGWMSKGCHDRVDCSILVASMHVGVRRLDALLLGGPTSRNKCQAKNKLTIECCNHSKQRERKACIESFCKKGALKSEFQMKVG